MSDDTLTPMATGEIRSLIERKEELERWQRKQDCHRQRVQVSEVEWRNTLQRRSRRASGARRARGGVGSVDRFRRRDKRRR